MQIIPNPPAAAAFLGFSVDLEIWEGTKLERTKKLEQVFNYSGVNTYKQTFSLLPGVSRVITGALMAYLILTDNPVDLLVNANSAGVVNALHFADSPCLMIKLTNNGTDEASVVVTYLSN